MSLYGWQVRTNYLSVIIVLHREKNLPVHFVSLLLLGIVKQAPWILFCILLILAHSRDGITQSIFETECVSLTFIFIWFNYFWTYHIFSFCTWVIFIWKIESSRTALSFFWHHQRECSQHAHYRIYISLSYPQQYDLSVHHAGNYTLVKKEAITHCVWHCHFYPNRNCHCKYGQCFNVQRLHKAPCRNNVLSWQIPRYFSMLNVFFSLFI